jgi:hypothetical protein
MAIPELFDLPVLCDCTVTIIDALALQADQATCVTDVQILLRQPDDGMPNATHTTVSMGRSRLEGYV